nr:FAD-dependent oxidoreductase [Neorickettsia findlayensis]
MTHVELSGLTGESVTLEADYLLAFFGLKPSLRHLEEWGLDITHHRINVDPLTCSTNINGVYAVGDVAYYDSKLKLILSGFSEAATACHHIREKLWAEMYTIFATLQTCTKSSDEKDMSSIPVAETCLLTVLPPVQIED